MPVQASLLVFFPVVTVKSVRPVTSRTGQPMSLQTGRENCSARQGRRYRREITNESVEVCFICRIVSTLFYKFVSSCSLSLWLLRCAKREQDITRHAVSNSHITGRHEEHVSGNNGAGGSHRAPLCHDSIHRFEIPNRIEFPQNVPI